MVSGRLRWESELEIERTKIGERDLPGQDFLFLRIDDDNTCRGLLWLGNRVPKLVPDNSFESDFFAWSVERSLGEEKGAARLRQRFHP